MPQDWRCFIEWELAEGAKYENCGFSFGPAAAVGFDGQGQPCYISAGAIHEVKTSLTARKVKLEADFVYRKYNFYLNDELLADFVDFADVGTEAVSSFTVRNPDNNPIIDKVWGVGYHRRDGDVYEPYTIETFIDLGRQEPACVNGWNKQGFNEQGWETGVLPIVHGGERYEGQDIYMRKGIDVDEIPPLARLTLESLTPGGEVYVNGRLAAFIQDECRHQVDVTKYLRAGKNLLAVRVYAYKVAERDKMTHTHTDLNTGWFAGRMYLDLLPEIYIEDVFSWTDSLSEGSAVQKVKVSMRAARGMVSKAAAGAL